jgi:1,4-alpha-glucan branching enzyme
VWSAEHGYPGDPQYRDFYRDIGFDMPLDYIGPHVHPEGHRLYTGFKYHAITHAQLHDKWVYDPDAARSRAGLHASHFRGALEKQVERLASGMDRPPMVVSPYDAVPRRCLPPAAPRPGLGRGDHPRRLSRSAPGQPGRHALCVLLG